MGREYVGRGLEAKDFVRAIVQAALDHLELLRRDGSKVHVHCQVPMKNVSL